VERAPGERQTDDDGAMLPQHEPHDLDGVAPSAPKPISVTRWLTENDTRRHADRVITSASAATGREQHREPGQ